MLTILADHNIAHLHDYFNQQVLGVPVNLVTMAGRDMNAKIITHHQPDALLIRSVTQVNEKLLQGNKSVKFVGSATIGTDHIDQAHLAKQNIAFANAAGCSKHSVAQYVITAILTLRPSYWSALKSKPVKLGIIGLGNIGSTLAKYASDLGWQVLGYDPLLPASPINNADFDTVMTQSDVVSLHVPLTTIDTSPYPTQHLINSDALAKMPADTLLINSARGQVVCEADLLADINKNNRQVVLDVFEHEPVVSAQLLNQLAIATPHIAGYTLEGKLRGTQMVFEAFINTFAEQLQVKHLPTLQSLLPDNPYLWQELKADSERLTEFYDIKADDGLLRGAINQQKGQVAGQDFDNLRKEYKLRREWRFC